MDRADWPSDHGKSFHRRHLNGVRTTDKCSKATLKKGNLTTTNNIQIDTFITFIQPMNTYTD